MAKRSKSLKSDQNSLSEIEIDWSDVETKKKENLHFTTEKSTYSEDSETECKEQKTPSNSNADSRESEAEKPDVSGAKEKETIDSNLDSNELCKSEHEKDKTRPSSSAYCSSNDAKMSDLLQTDGEDEMDLHNENSDCKEVLGDKTSLESLSVLQRNDTEMPGVLNAEDEEEINMTSNVIESNEVSETDHKEDKSLFRNVSMSSYKSNPTADKASRKGKKRIRTFNYYGSEIEVTLSEESP